MIVYLTLSFLEILAERRQKSISVEFNFATVFAFKRHFSAANHTGWILIALTTSENLLIVLFHYLLNTSANSSKR
jgi:phosphoheptose isomerase